VLGVALGDLHASGVRGDDDQVVRVFGVGLQYSSNTGAATRWSTGMLKNPWIWPEWKSTESTRLARPPGACRDELGSDGLAPADLRLVGVAVVGDDRGDALGRRAFGASIMMSCSITASLTGVACVCTMNTCAHGSTRRNDSGSRRRRTRADWLR